MMLALASQQWRRTLASPVQVAALVLLTLVQPLQCAAAGVAPDPGAVQIAIALVVGAGLVGRDASEGTLRAILARPISMPAYIVARWSGATAMASALMLAQFAASTVALLAWGDGLPSARVLVGQAVALLLLAGSVHSVLAVFSVVLPGAGDAGAFVMAILAYSLAAEFVVPAWPALEPALESARGWLAGGRAIAGWPFDEAVGVASSIAANLLVAMIGLRYRNIPGGGSP